MRKRVRVRKNPSVSPPALLLGGAIFVLVVTFALAPFLPRVPSR